MVEVVVAVQGERQPGQGGVGQKVAALKHLRERHQPGRRDRKQGDVNGVPVPGREVHQRDGGVGRERPAAQVEENGTDAAEGEIGDAGDGLGRRQLEQGRRAGGEVGIGGVAYLGGYQLEQAIQGCEG